GDRAIPIQQLGDNAGRPPDQFLPGGGGARDLRALRQGKVPQHPGRERPELGDQPRRRRARPKRAARGAGVPGCRERQRQGPL
ncbi:MAG: hypothetical protein AVDCRST_MAG12-649, partial [uncultured Rubrobacteraceae bacterium]